MKKTITILLLAIVGLSGAFASDVYESGTLFYTNSFVDDSDEYIATERKASVEILDASGNTIDSFDGNAFYSVRNYGSLIERSTSGDSRTFELIDQIYDGYVMTPFNNAVYAYDDNDSDPVEEDVNGVSCLVYSYDVALDGSAFFSGKKEGGLVGWDSADGEPDGDITMTVTVDSQSGAIVRTVTTYDVSSLEYTMEADFTVLSVDGTEINVPAEVVTTGSVATSTSAPAIRQSVNFRIAETFSSYTEADGYHDC